MSYAPSYTIGRMTMKVQGSYCRVGGVIRRSGFKEVGSSTQTLQLVVKYNPTDIIEVIQLCAKVPVRHKEIVHPQL